MDVTTGCTWNGCTWNADLRLWVAAAPPAVADIVAAAAVTLGEWEPLPEPDGEEQAITDARLIAALESDREALRRVIDGLAARVARAEEAHASVVAVAAPPEPPNPLVWAVAAHPWLRDPKATWRMGL